MCTYDMLEIGIRHGGPRGAVAADGPGVEHDVVRLEAKLADGELHDAVDSVLLLLGKRLALLTTTSQTEYI